MYKGDRMTDIIKEKNLANTLSRTKRLFFPIKKKIKSTIPAGNKNRYAPKFFFQSICKYYIDLGKKSTIWFSYCFEVNVRIKLEEKLCFYLD